MSGHAQGVLPFDSDDLLRATQSELPKVMYVNNGLFSENFLTTEASTGKDWKRIDYPEITKQFEILRDIYERNEKYLNPETDESVLEDKFINRILEDVLGFKRIKKTLNIDGEMIAPDSLLFSTDEIATSFKADDLESSLLKVIAIVEAKRWNVDLDKKQGENRSPSGQLLSYMKTTGVPFGILTNGSQWRLYHRDSLLNANTYFQINVNHIINQKSINPEMFEFFSNIFSLFSYIRKSINGEAEIISLFKRNKEYGRTLEHDLKIYLFSSIEWIITGYVKTRSIENNKFNLENDYVNSLKLMYRILFILRAEDSMLLPLRSPQYFEHSLRKIAEDSAEIVTAWDRGELNSEKRKTSLFSRLQILSKVIDKGDKSFDLPIGFNGGLFSDILHPSVFKTEISNEYFARALYQITRLKDPFSGKIVRVNFSTIDFDHIGSIYEGLLEFEPRTYEENGFEIFTDKGPDLLKKLPLKGKNSIKILREVKKGDIYLLNNKLSIRKNTGSYYTPNWVVDFALQLSSLDLKIQNATSIDELSQITICDPAMGSGHFLAAVAKRLISRANEIVDASNIVPIFNFEEHIIQSCIFGVDINSLTTLLAKLSIWVLTAKPNQKLINLDENLITGNSLFDYPGSNTLPASKRKFNWYKEFPKIFKGSGFSYIVGNPPWGADISQIKEFLPELFPDVPRENLNAFDLFIRQAIRISSMDCHIVFVLPRNLIRTSDYLSLRKDIIAPFIDSVADIGEAFEGVTTEAIILNLKQNAKNSFQSYPLTKILASQPEPRIEKSHLKSLVISRNCIIAPDFRVNLFETEILSRVIKVMNENSNPLNTYVNDISRGIEIGGNGEVGKCPKCKNFITRPKKKKKDYKECPFCATKVTLDQLKPLYIISKELNSKNNTRIISGRNISKYKIVGEKYLQLGLPGVNYKLKIFNGSPSIFIGKIGGVLNSYYDPSGTLYSTQGALIVKPKVAVNHYWLTAVLNSHIMQFFYEYIYLNGAELTANLTNEQLERLPIPPLSDVNNKTIIKLVKSLQTKARLDYKLVTEINTMVYSAFGLKRSDQGVIEEFMAMIKAIKDVSYEEKYEDEAA